jgi:hypothetical protein
VASPLTVRFEVIGRPHGTALLAADDSIWVVFNPPWYDLATWIWWWMCPSERRAKVTLTTHDDEDNVKGKFRAIHIADKYVRIKGRPKTWR